MTAAPIAESGHLHGLQILSFGQHFPLHKNESCTMLFHRLDTLILISFMYMNQALCICHLEFGSSSVNWSTYVTMVRSTTNLDSSEPRHLRLPPPKLKSTVLSILLLRALQSASLSFACCSQRLAFH
ncbi:hypothetical protein KC355_g4 [Hortaea werneckii]|nr:hypothetical protein KC355_g4 [Hortaea werneckii]